MLEELERRNYSQSTSRVCQRASIASGHMIDPIPTKLMESPLRTTEILAPRVVLEPTPLRLTTIKDCVALIGLSSMRGAGPELHQSCVFAHSRRIFETTVKWHASKLRNHDSDRMFRPTLLAYSMERVHGCRLFSRLQHGTPKQNRFRNAAPVLKAYSRECAIMPLSICDDLLWLVSFGPARVPRSSLVSHERAPRSSAGFQACEGSH
jgi:hypothetical protein